MSMTTLLGLSFGVFPCLLFGFIMLLSLLICEYIEEYVAKHLCAWKNRRRRGLRSFYRDFRERRDAQNNSGNHHYHYGSSGTRSRTNSPSSPPPPWPVSGGDNDDLRLIEQFPPSAPPSQSFGAQYPSTSRVYPALPQNDPPPSYEECVLPYGRLYQSNDNTPQPTKPSRRSSKGKD